MNGTKFRVGQRVRSTVSAQGLAKGRTYEVVNVESVAMPWGFVVQYVLRDADGHDRAVGNGHIILEAAS